MTHTRARLCACINKGVLPRDPICGEKLDDDEE